MDNITHSLTGLFLSRAGFRRVTPNATPILILAANIPDFDVISLVNGPLAYLRWHRHMTHALVAIPVMAILAVVLVRLIGRQPVRWLPAFGIAMLGVLSHILLDLTNIYGVRLLLPFSGAWTHWDIAPVVDITIWAILLLGLAAPFLNRILNAELGVREKNYGPGWAVLSLLLLLGYDWARRDLHDLATAQLDVRRFEGLAPRRTGAFPHQNPLLWDGIVELSVGYVQVPLNIRDSVSREPGDYLFKGERTPALTAARQTEPFEYLQEFVQWPLWTSIPSLSTGNTEVTLRDLRFGTGFSAVATVTKNGKVLESKYVLGTPKIK